MSVKAPNNCCLKTNHISWYCNTSMSRIFLTFQSFFWKLTLFLWTLLGLEMMDENRKRSLQRWPHFPSVLFRQWWIPCMLSPKIRCRPLCLLDWLMFSGRTMGRGLHSSILQQQQFIVWWMGRSDGALWSWVRSRSWRIEMEKWRTEARTRGHLHSERTLWRWPHPWCLDTAQGRVSYNRESLHVNIKLKKQL